MAVLGGLHGVVFPTHKYFPFSLPIFLNTISFISKTVWAMIIFQLAIGAFILGGGVITLTNWLSERLDKKHLSA